MEATIIKKDGKATMDKDFNFMLSLLRNGEYTLTIKRKTKPRTLDQNALISGQPIPVSSGGGGGNSDSDLRWDGRRPDEEEEAYKRRCLMHAVQVARNSQRKTIRR